MSTAIHQTNSSATGYVTQVFGNLLYVHFEGEIRQGEVAYILLGDLKLKAEVIEIKGQEAKVQVFEDTRGISYHTPVTFASHLLEAELGPGLMSGIFDGLQNPLKEVSDIAGLYLSRGVYVLALDRTKHWDYHPTCRIGDRLRRGDELGFTMENSFHHSIMIPFNLYHEYTVEWVVEPGSYTVDTVVAKVRSSQGELIELSMVQKWPVKMPLIQGKKVRAHEMMDTGMRIIDTQFPIIRGGTFCSPGPFGAGKTVLQHHLSKYSAVDIVVIVACGERAGEIVEVVKTFPYLKDPHTNESLMSRTVMICNTSSMPVSAREASIYLGATIAEYYRQMGLHILMLADSTSRWAQAMREMSGRLEEIPGEEAFPAYLASRIAAFYERAGLVELANKKKGSLTIGGAVSPAGGNFEEPVTQATLAVVGAFLGLSRERSNARKYPAIDPMISWSKYLEPVAAQMKQSCAVWGKTVKAAQHLLRAGDEIGKRMEVVGEEGISLDDLVTYLKAELYEFSYLQQNAFDKEDTYCQLKRQVKLIELIEAIFHMSCSFTSHDEARAFFMSLQNEIKNMNFIPFESEKYYETYQKAMSKVVALQNG